MLRQLILASVILGSQLAPAASAEFDAEAAHRAFTESFNARNWSALRSVLADDVVFHRANAPEVYVGADAVVEIFTSTIGANDQWNVKFAILDTSDEFVGNDG
jgi:hypothetical protein